MKRVRIGCSGWNYKSWRERFYPKGLPARLWLEHYAKFFDTVEVNNTFYRLPTRKAVEGWLAQAPPGFVFAVKASRYLTHVRRLRDLETGVRRLWERWEPLATSPHMGPVLWQLPATFHRDDERLAAWLRALPPGRHTLEVRDESWMADAVIAQLRGAGVALCIADHPERRWQRRDLTADFTYVRLHHGRSGRRGSYSATELDAWAKELKRLARRAEVFAYFNNDWEGFAVRNALGLRARLGQ